MIGKRGLVPPFATPTTLPPTPALRPWKPIAGCFCTDADSFLEVFAEPKAWSYAAIIFKIALSYTILQYCRYSIAYHFYGKIVAVHQ